MENLQICIDKTANDWITKYRIGSIPFQSAGSIPFWPQRDNCRYKGEYCRCLDVITFQLFGTSKRSAAGMVAVNLKTGFVKATFWGESFSSAFAISMYGSSCHFLFWVLIFLLLCIPSCSRDANKEIQERKTKWDTKRELHTDVRCAATNVYWLNTISWFKYVLFFSSLFKCP